MTTSASANAMMSPKAPSSASIRAILLLLALAGLPISAWAQSYTTSPPPFLLAQNNSGTIINNACIWTYVAGTSTVAATYQTATGTLNTNPIRSDSAGRFVAFLTPGSSYKFVYESACTPPAHGTVLKTADGIGAMPPSGTNIDITGTAGESLTAGAAVYLSDGSGGKNAGQWYNADADFTYASTTPRIGFAITAISSTGTGSIRIGGQITGLAGLTIGATYYVSATAGAITTTAPTNVRSVGQANSATTLVLAVDPTPTSTAATIQTTTSTGSVNNFAATAARWLVLRANNATALTLTGITAGSAGDAVDIFAVNSTLTLNHLDGSSTAANQIRTPTGTNLQITSGRLVYDATTAVWRLETYATPSMTLLAEVSGTTTNAAAENITLAAISGLTVKDKILVVGTWEAVTQQTASLFLYNSTDSKNLAEMDAGAAIPAGMTVPFSSILGPAQSAATLITARTEYARVTTNDTDTTGALAGYRNAVTTAWTGSWTFALRQGGVTAGGTGKYEASIYILRGQ